MEIRPSTVLSEWLLNNGHTEKMTSGGVIPERKDNRLLKAFCTNQKYRHNTNWITHEDERLLATCIHPRTENQLQEVDNTFSFGGLTFMADFIALYSVLFNGKGTD